LVSWACATTRFASACASVLRGTRGSIEASS
jgi:hypothetical protein